MPGENIIRGAQPVEYVKEDSGFATLTGSSKTWNWFGLGTSFSVTEGVESESITYLPEYGASNKLEKRKNVAHREIWEGEITYHPQDFSLLSYFTGADGDTSDSLDSIQIGEINEDADPDEFRRMYGGVGEELTFSVGEDESAEITGNFMFADGEDWGTTDYIDSAGGGAHAPEDTSEPFIYSDLGNVSYGGSAIDDAVESLEFTISNELAMVRDPDSTNATLIDAIVPVDREITVDLTLTYSDYSMASEVRSYTAQDLTFDVGTTTFTINGVQFPEAPHELTPDDLVSDSVSSDPANGFSWV